MKILLSTIIFLFTITLSAQTNIKNQRAVIQTNLYCDHCKSCETCGQNFQDNLYKVKGLKTYELDEKAMTITVIFDGRKTNLDAIRNKIAALGYDADQIKADVAAYDKLDECCKKG